MTVLLALALATAAPAMAKNAKPIAKPAAAATCPVTGEKIAKVTPSTLKSSYKGKTYYFCCAACKPAFDKNPAKYVKK
jgi:YHS domain-containing protein